MKSLLLFLILKWVDWHLKIRTTPLLQPCQWTPTSRGITDKIKQGLFLIDALCVNDYFDVSFGVTKVRLVPYFNGFCSHWRCYVETCRLRLNINITRIMDPHLNLLSKYVYVYVTMEWLRLRLCFIRLGSHIRYLDHVRTRQVWVVVMITFKSSNNV